MYDVSIIGTHVSRKEVILFYMPNNRKRRTKGEGSIVEYRKGHFRAFLDLGKHPVTHKRVRKTFSGTSRAEVLKKLQNALADKNKGVLTHTSNTPFNVFALHFLELKKNTIKESTFTYYKTHIEKDFIPILKDTPIARIDVNKINQLLNYMLNVKKNSPTSIKTKKTTLHAIFKQAIYENLITKNPVEFSIKLSKSRAKKEIIPFTKQEISSLLAASKDNNSLYTLYPIIRLVIETGMRRGEVLGLHWDDIDYTKNTITIKRSVSSFGVTSTKTTSSYRTLIVSKDTLEMLKKYKKHDTKVFVNAIYSYLSPNLLSKKFKILCNRLGIVNQHFHNLRHTNATWLINQGVDIATVSRRLGHSNISTTLNTYTHFIPESDEKASTIIGSLISTCD